MTDYIKLNGVHAGNSQLIDQLEENLMSFFEWGLLEAGFYDDVTIYSLGTNDQTYPTPENLYPVAVPHMSGGRVWEAPYKNWVYESAFESIRQPIAVSGIYVDGVFNPVNGSGQHSYSIDYLNGRVTFDDAISIDSVVQANYSYKRISFYDEDVPWFTTLAFDSFGPGASTSILPSGVTGLLKQHQLQLPLIVVEASKQEMKPRELGNITQWVYQDFLFHVVAETSQDRNNLVDIIARQKDKIFYLYDVNAVAANNAYALDYKNSLVLGKPLYPTLVMPYPNGFRMTSCRFYNVRKSESYNSLPLYRAVVRVTMEVDDSVPFGGWRVGTNGVVYQSTTFGTKKFGPYSISV